MDQVTFFLDFFAALFAIANPVGNIPFFLMYTTNVASTRTRHAVAILLGPAIFITLLLCMFFGSAVLSFFGVSMPAFEIAGAIILVVIALSMISGTRTEQVHAVTSSDSGLTPWKAAEAYIPTIFVPLIFPIYIGGGTITVAALYGHEALTGGFLAAAIGVPAIICVMIIICNLASDAIMRVLGRQGLEIVVRVFGIILLGIAVQMFAQGASEMATAFIQANLPSS
jgi:multiple antibiotic resistance protein